MSPDWVWNLVNLQTDLKETGLSSWFDWGPRNIVLAIN
jgi:hypothetical protein